MSFLNDKYYWSMEITSEESWFSWGSFTAAILPETSWYVFLTLVEDALEYLLFALEIVLEAILDVSVALFSLRLNNAT